MNLGNLPVLISQKLSPFSCCKKAVNTQKQINLYQTQIDQPVKLLSKQKNSSIQKIVHISNFYPANEQNNYKVVGKSNYQIQLKKCLQKNQMFDDKEFKANELSLGINKQDKKIVWRRLSQIYDSKKYTIFDAGQQIDFTELQMFNMKDHIMIPILQLLIKRRSIVKQIFRKFEEKINNFGIYKLVLNERGYPRQIIIDDFVPVFQNTDKHVFSRPFNNQLWPLLIQKAIAKILGSYHQIQNAKCYQILRILTMAPTVKFQVEQNIKENKYQQNWQNIKQSLKQNLIIFCKSKDKPRSRKIRPSYCYMIGTIQFNHNQQSQSLIVLNNLQNLFQQSSEQSSQNLSIPDTSVKRSLQRNRLKLKYSSFVKNFDEFFVCHYRQNYNFDFQAGQMINRNPQMFKLKVKQTSNQILSFCRVNRQYYTNSFVNLNDFQKKVRNFIGIKGGWLKILVAKLKIQNGQTQIKYVEAITQTQDNSLSLNLRHLKPGQYIIYTEGYSQQNQQQHYVFSCYSQKAFSLQRQIPSSINKHYFLQQVPESLKIGNAESLSLISI